MFDIHGEISLKENIIIKNNWINVCLSVFLTFRTKFAKGRKVIYLLINFFFIFVL